jgi:hypothetical protein
MTEEAKMNTILSALYKRTNRVPIPFNKELEFMQSLGLTDSAKFTTMCHHLEVLGYVKYVASNGLQLTDSGYQFIKGGGFVIPPIKYSGLNTIFHDVPLSFAEKLKVLFGAKISVEVVYNDEVVTIKSTIK